MGDLLGPVLKNREFLLAQNLCGLFFIVLWIAISFWMYRDANRRGAMGWFWALAALMFPSVGLLVWIATGLFGAGGAVALVGVSAVWAIYLVVRPPETSEDAHERTLAIRQQEVALANEYPSCPACYKPVETEFLICPYCMKKLKKPCVECGKALRLNWGVCPYCKTKQ